MIGSKGQSCASDVELSSANYQMNPVLEHIKRGVHSVQILQLDFVHASFALETDFPTSAAIGFRLINHLLLEYWNCRSAVVCIQAQEVIEMDMNLKNRVFLEQFHLHPQKR